MGEHEVRHGGPAGVLLGRDQLSVDAYGVENAGFRDLARRLVAPRVEHPVVLDPHERPVLVRGEVRRRTVVGAVVGGDPVPRERYRLGVLRVRRRGGTAGRHEDGVKLAPVAVGRPDRVHGRGVDGRGVDERPVRAVGDGPDPRLPVDVLLEGQPVEVAGELAYPHLAHEHVLAGRGEVLLDGLVGTVRPSPADVLALLHRRRGDRDVGLLPADRGEVRRFEARPQLDGGADHVERGARVPLVLRPELVRPLVVLADLRLKPGGERAEIRRVPCPEVGLIAGPRRPQRLDPSVQILPLLGRQGHRGSLPIGR